MSIASLVLFDLDGTLVDTAPDLAAAVNAVLAELGRGALPAERIRPVVSKGARAMLARALPEFDEARREALVPRFLELYGRNLAHHSAPFDGIEAVLARIEAVGARWGIVTNKPEALAQTLLEALDLQRRCAVLIGGDTLPQRKPDPLPLLEACARTGTDVADAVYVGDDERDVLAARAAPMVSVAALWGYRLDEDRVEVWGADRVAESPRALLQPGMLAAAR